MLSKDKIRFDDFLPMPSCDLHCWLDVNCQADDADTFVCVCVWAADQITLRFSAVFLWVYATLWFGLVCVSLIIVLMWSLCFQELELLTNLFTMCFYLNIRPYCLIAGEINIPEEIVISTLLHDVKFVLPRVCSLCMDWLCRCDLMT